ncbi:hypothetical protein K227x_31440 [Rubripirellula lacrimiformis]|uniref:Uncharacterized protein n=2 Tax=Rubripirellula lacrimiformis TaxID=1930273 RepID=A0A517NC98_9BACT|nr:hypothetical protein K227x_31440 [Rubripirellula lacrimiformis]
MGFRKEELRCTISYQPTMACPSHFPVLPIPQNGHSPKVMFATPNLVRFDRLSDLNIPVMCTGSIHTGDVFSAI